MVAPPLKKCFLSPPGKRHYCPLLEKVIPTPKAELKTKTRNVLKCIDSLLRVALEELIHLQFEKLIT